MFLDKFSHYPKPVIFALLGATGALLGALLGELLPLAETAQATRSVINFSPETRKRMLREEAEEGEIELALSWHNRNDLDLHCISPKSEHIYFLEKRCASGGFLDVDMNFDIASAVDTPIEHIRWKEDTAPLGKYEVLVHHYSRHITDSDPTEYTVEMKWGDQFKTVTGSLTHKHPSGLYPPETATMDDAVSIHTFTYQAPDPTSAVTIVLLVGLWASLLAIGTGIGLVIGQNSMLRRSLLSVREAGMIAGFGLLAGLASGGFSQLAYHAVSGTGSFRWIGQVGAWMLLGGLLAMGISLFVPNMKPIRGLAGGVAGGAAGSLAFLLVGSMIGNAPARLIGAALLGLCIGAVIALVDAFFREAWIEVHYGPNEMRTVALGRKPIAIGSNREFSTVMAQGTADVALRYTLLDGRISCEDVPAGRTVDVHPGDRRTAGNLEVVVCVARSTATTSTAAGPPGEGVSRSGPPGSSAGIYNLRIRGRQIPLAVGARLKTSDIAGLETTESDNAVAEVTAHPKDPKLLGLKNLSKRRWKATMPEGKRKDVEPGQNVRLTAGVAVDFGVLKGVIE